MMAMLEAEKIFADIKSLLALENLHCIFLQFLGNAFPGSTKLGLCYLRAKIIFLNNAVVYYKLCSQLLFL